MIGEYIYMLPCGMNLRIGRVKGYNNKILVSKPGFKLGTNVEINLDVEKDKPDAKSKGKEIVKTKSNIESKQDVKPNIEPKQDVKPNIEFNKESKPDMNIRSPMRKKR